MKTSTMRKPVGELIGRPFYVEEPPLVSARGLWRALPTALGTLGAAYLVVQVLLWWSRSFVVMR